MRASLSRSVVAALLVGLLAGCAPAVTPSPAAPAEAAKAKPAESKPAEARPATAASPAPAAKVVAAPAVPSPTPAAAPAAAAKPAAALAPAPKAAGPPRLKVTMILPGPVQDADYNAVGYAALQEIQQQTGAEVTFAEQVAVADAERVARQYLASGHNVIAFHGGQFATVVTNLAPQFPDAFFIMESSGQLPKLPPNVWNIGRKLYQGFYALGVLAATTTGTNKVGFIGGARLPEFVSSVNAIRQQAFKEFNPKAELLVAFTGDQNDPIKAREAAASQINSGVDFIIVAVNLGVHGIVESSRSASKPALLTTFYTDKKDLAPDLFTTSLLADFSAPYLDVIKNIQAGQKGGYIEMRPGTGFTLAPIANVPENAAQKTQTAFDEVAGGYKQIPEVTDRIVE